MFSFLRCKPSILADRRLLASAPSHTRKRLPAQSQAQSWIRAADDSRRHRHATSEKTGQSRGSTTNSEGRFNFAALQPGLSLKVERRFSNTRTTRRDPERNENLALGDLKLQPDR
jgi:hypothetical protein